MALITVDGGGTWWPSSGPLLRAGVHETVNPNLIAEALASEFDFVSVQLDEGEEDNLPSEPVANADPAEVTPVVLAEPQDGSGQLTTDDTNLTKLASGLLCGLCPERGPFANKAALNAHRRAKHPEVDPQTGEAPASAQPEAV